MSTDETTYPKYRFASCGCCTGDGLGARPANDQCICWNHQNRPMGRPPRICTHHAKAHPAVAATFDAMKAITERNMQRGHS